MYIYMCVLCICICWGLAVLRSTAMHDLGRHGTATSTSLLCRDENERKKTDETYDVDIVAGMACAIPDSLVDAPFRSSMAAGTLHGNQ